MLAAWVLNFSIAAAAPAPIAANPIKAKTLAAFSRYLDKLFQDADLPGFAFAIVYKDKILLQKTLGVRSTSSRKPINEHTRFKLGAVSTALTSLLAASFQSKGRDSFDVQAHELYNQFSLAEPKATQRCQLHHLLSMKAGIPTWLDGTLDLKWGLPADLFTLLAQTPLLNQPGEAFHRSLVSPAIGGYLIAKAMRPNKSDLHASYIQLVQERIFEPLAMHRATFSSKLAQSDANYASPHALKSGYYKPIHHSKTEKNQLMPATEAKASLKDVIQWLRFELSLGASVQKPIASAAALQQRWRPSGKNRFGMGWQTHHHQGLAVIVNSSSYDGHTALVGFFPTHKIGFATLINTADANSVKCIQEILLSLSEILAKAP